MSCCVRVHYRTDDQFTDSSRVIASLTAGGVAGVVSWIPAVPFDVIKSLIQVSTAMLAKLKIISYSRILRDTIQMWPAEQLIGPY